MVVIGEFCGTFMFLLLSLIGAQTAINNNNPSNPDSDAPLLPMTLLYIACSFGAALAVNVWIFFRVTGGMFNPAVSIPRKRNRLGRLTVTNKANQVTLGLTLVGAVTPLRAAMIIPTQLIAGILSAAVVKGLLPGSLQVGNALSNGTTPVQGLFLEMFLTAQLVLTIYFLAVEKHRATCLAPIGIGLSVFMAHLALTNYTGTSVNPARSFGPAVFVGFPGYHWIYWLGPVLGSVLAFGLYTLMKWLDYTTANPGQDSDNISRANNSNTNEDARKSQAGFQSRSTLVGSPTRVPRAVKHGNSSSDMQIGDMSRAYREPSKGSAV